MKRSVFLFAAFAGLVLPATAAPAATAKADAVSRLEEATNALAMVQKAFEPFPGDLLRSEVLRNEDGSPMVEVGENGSVKVKVRIAVDPALYREWTKGLMQKLDAVSTTYEDGTVPCVLVNSAASLALASMPGMGADLPPEYAAMAAQAVQMGGGMGGGMGYAAAMPVHPLAQMELAGMENAAADPPSISFKQNPARGNKGRFVLRVVRPGQDAVWKGKPGDVELRARVYTFGEGQSDSLSAFKADRIRRFILDAMQSPGRKAGSETGPAKADPRLVNPSGNGKVVLSVSILAGKEVLAKKALYPSNHRPSREEIQDAKSTGTKPLVYPLSVSAVAPSGMWRNPDEVVISPFLLSDSAHCYQAWEDWVSVGVLSDADLERVTDIRSKVFFR
jgi:hypothetical protein